MPAIIVGRETLDPDEILPPLVVTVGRDDDGDFHVSLQIAGLPAIVAAALLTDAAATLAQEANAKNAHMLLSTCAQAFWIMSTGGG